MNIKKDINTPIILLTAKGEPNERIEGLRDGSRWLSAETIRTKRTGPKN